ncbi:MAG: PEGA domain-containing protein [Ignavibacteria bacterium]|nr:PEGA domain-containing protein [Ignavibacteria bacterium]
MRIVLICAMLLAAGRASGQPAVPQDSATGELDVHADVDSSLVMLDGQLVGTTPVTLSGVAAGVHLLRVLHPDLQNWNAPVIADSIEITSGERLEKQYYFERQYMLQTNPSGAEVILGSRVIGVTPLVVRPGAGDSTVQIRKPGYESGMVMLADADRGQLSVSMVRDPDWITQDGIVTDAGRSSTLPIVLSGVSSVIAGGFSAYFKVQADQAYGEYALSGDPAKLAQTRKLDNVAGIALAASQIYFALFSYLLITQ